MKTMVAFLILVLASALAASAGQEQVSAENLEQLRQRFEEIRKRLDLTPEQAEQVRPVLVEELQKLKALQDKYAAGNQNLRARLEALRDLRDIRSATNAKLQKILSKEQMDEMEEIREEWREQFRERGAAR
jgi:hypothetical protein